MGELVGQAAEPFLGDLTSWEYWPKQLRALAFGLVEVFYHLIEGRLGITDETSEFAHEPLDRQIAVLAFRLNALKLSSKLLESFIVRLILGLDIG